MRQFEGVDRIRSTKSQTPLEEGVSAGLQAWCLVTCLSGLGLNVSAN